MKVILMKVVDIDFQNTVIPYFHRMPLKRKTKHMALDGTVQELYVRVCLDGSVGYGSK